MTVNQEGEPVGISGQDWREQPGSIMTAGCWEGAGPGGSSTQFTVSAVSNVASTSVTLKVNTF